MSYFLKICFLSERVRFKSKKWNSSHHYNLFQQGPGNYEDSEESDFSQETEVSQASWGTESSQEETESLEPWSRIFDEAEKRHETQFNTLINEYEGNGESENMARVKTENALVPVHRKELRKVFLENLQWMRVMKKDPTFKKVMETQKELKDSEGFDRLESTELAIDKRIYSTRSRLDLLWMLQNFLFPGPLSVLLRFNKTVNKQTLSVFYWWLHNLYNLLSIQDISWNLLFQTNLFHLFRTNRKT